MGKMKAELVMEKDEILRKRLDLNLAHEKQTSDMSKVKNLNDELIKQVEDLQRKLSAVDPEVLKEQKELIGDLKGKVSVLEREL